MSLSAIQSFAPLRTEPADFQRFWDGTMDELSQVDPAPRLLSSRKKGAWQYQEITFRSLDDALIKGYLIRQPFAAPLIVHTHGYNDQYDVMGAWSDRGFHVMGLDLRGFGRSTYPIHPKGYVLTGLQNKRESILRGAVCDVVQALSSSTVLLGEDVSHTILYGFSFGGAMAVMAGALSKTPDLIVVGQPTLGWHSERRRVSTAGSTQELNDFLEENPSLERQTTETFGYFDALHFAARISTPTLLGVGLDDFVVPSRTVLAIYNHLGSSQKVLRLLPIAHSHDPREDLWDQFHEEWLNIAKNPVPANFGGSETQVKAIMTMG